MIFKRVVTPLIVWLATLSITVTTTSSSSRGHVTHNGSYREKPHNLNRYRRTADDHAASSTANNDYEEFSSSPSSSSSAAGDIYGPERDICFRRQEADFVTLTCDNQNNSDSDSTDDSDGGNDKRLIILDAYFMSNLTADYDFKFLHKGYTPYIIPRVLAARRSKSNAACWSQLALPPVAGPQHPEHHGRHHGKHHNSLASSAPSQDRLNCVEDMRSTFNSKCSLRANCSLSPVLDHRFIRCWDTPTAVILVRYACVSDQHITRACNRELRDETAGLVSSVNYPNFYALSLGMCEWNISTHRTGSVGHSIGSSQHQHSTVELEMLDVDIEGPEEESVAPLIGVKNLMIWDSDLVQEELRRLRKHPTQSGQSCIDRVEVREIFANGKTSKSSTYTLCGQHHMNLLHFTTGDTEKLNVRLIMASPRASIISMNRGLLFRYKMIGGCESLQSKLVNAYLTFSNSSLAIVSCEDGYVFDTTEEWLRSADESRRHVMTLSCDAATLLWNDTLPACIENPSLGSSPASSDDYENETGATSPRGSSSSSSTSSTSTSTSNGHVPSSRFNGKKSPQDGSAAWNSVRYDKNGERSRNSIESDEEDEGEDYGASQEESVIHSLTRSQRDERAEFHLQYVIPVICMVVLIVANIVVIWTLVRIRARRRAAGTGGGVNGMSGLGSGSSSKYDIQHHTLRDDGTQLPLTNSQQPTDL